MADKRERLTSVAAGDGPARRPAFGGPPRRLVLILLGAVAAVSWLPVLGVLATIAAAVATGCQVDEAAVHPCIVAGHDIGEALGIGLLLIFVAGPAFPVALVTSVAWMMVRRRRRCLPAATSN